MPARTAVRLAGSVRAAVLDLAGNTAADAELLAAFARHRDPAAFEALVRRHGALVTATCRAVLHNPADADDAVQATLIVLYRKVGSVRDGHALPGWLFRVARRAALEVRKAVGRRRAHEARASRPEPAPAADLSWREACAVLHEEIDALPPRYRLPLIACYLEGKTQAEAARGLGCSAEVVRGRLDRGREKLRQRLRRRGIALSAALLAGAAVPATAPAFSLPAILDPSPAIATVARTVAGSAGRAWSAASASVLAAGLFVGTVVFGAGGADPPKQPPAPPAKEPATTKPGPRFDAYGDPLPDGAVARLGTVRLNHGEGMKAVLYSPDGKTIVSVGTGRARVWDADTGAERLLFSTGKSGWDEQAVVTADGKKLLLLLQEFDNDPLREFDLATGKELRSVTLPVKRKELSVTRKNALSPDGRLATLWGPDTVHVVDTESRKELHVLSKNGRQLTGLSFAGPDLIVTGDGKQIEVWEARTGKPVRAFEHDGPTGIIAGSTDGKHLVTLGHHTNAVDELLEKDVVRVWDLTTGKRIAELASRSGRWFMRIGFSPDGKAVYAYSQGREPCEVTVWDAATGERVREIPGAIGQVAAICPDGRHLAAGADALGKFDVWDLRTGKPTVPAESTRPWVASMFVSRDGDRVITLGGTSLATWDGTTGRRLGSTEVPPHLCESPWSHISPDGRFAVMIRGAETDGQQIDIWDVAAGKPAHTFTGKQPPYGVTVAFSRDSARVAIRFPGKDPLVTVRDLRTGKEVLSFVDTITKWPGYLFFTADGQTIVVAGRRVVGHSVADGRVQFSYRVEPAEAPKTGRRGGLVGDGEDEDPLGWRTFTMSPDGALAACVLTAPYHGFGGDPLANRLALLDARTGKVIRRWSDSGKPSRGYERLQFFPDGRLIASSDGSEVHVWEAATGKKIQTFRGHRNEVEALAFSGNGRRLASASHDSTVLVWDLSAPAGGDAATWWTDLLNEDGATGYAAVWRLADAADDVTMPLVRKHLRPVTDADSATMRKTIANLDSDEFRVRDRAFKELADLGHNAAPALRAALAKKPSTEAQARLEQLLAKVTGPPGTGESLRTIRALAVLEHKGTAEALKLLRELAAGADGMWLTEEAKTILRRASGQ